MNGFPEFILVREHDRHEARMDPRAFARIPLQRRVRLILERRVTFWMGTQEIDPKIALAAMRRVAARESEPGPPPSPQPSGAR